MASETVGRPEHQTPATELAFERLEASLAYSKRAGRRYPGDATFIPSDLPGFDVVVRRSLREHRPIIVIYPDGEERMVLSHLPARSRRYLFRLFRARFRSYRDWRAEP
jgi:hypothetical protein